MKKNAQFLVVFITLLLGFSSVKAQPDHYVYWSGGSNYIPFGFQYNRVQWLYYPTELTPVPSTPGVISTIYVYSVNAGPTFANYNELTVKLGMTNINTLTLGPWEPVTTVFYAASYTFPGLQPGWVAIPLQTPFFYDGVSNLIVEISQQSTVQGTGFWVEQGYPGLTRRMYGNTGNPNGAGTDGTQAAFGFDMFTMDNAGISELVEPVESSTFCAGIHQVKLRVINSGSNDIDSVRINWSINGVLQPTNYYIGNIPDVTNTNNSVMVNMGNVYFPHNVPITIKAWTSFPNGETDLDNSNDTLTETITATMQGIILNEMNDTVICRGDSLILDAGYNANTDYTWSNGTQAQVNIITQPGTYWVWAYNPSGCQAFDTFTVTLSPPPSAGPYVVGIDNGAGNFTFNLPMVSDADEWAWDFGDASPVVYGAAPITHTYTQAGSYMVSVTLSNKCGSTSRYGNIFTSGSNINEVSSIANSIDIYPSPATDFITIFNKNDNFTIKEINIFNSVGQRIFAADVKDKKSILNVTNFASGLYNIQIVTNKGNLNKKIEIIK